MGWYFKRLKKKIWNFHLLFLLVIFLGNAPGYLSGSIPLGTYLAITVKMKPVIHLVLAGMGILLSVLGILLETQGILQNTPKSPQVEAIST